MNHSTKYLGLTENVNWEQHIFKILPKDYQYPAASEEDVVDGDISLTVYF